MSVILETSLGEIVIDLLVENAPKCCENFLKLCKIKYYNFAPFHSVQKGFSCQTGDPLGPDSPESDGGSSVWGLLSGPSKKSFIADIDPKLKHSQRGTVSMATVASPNDPDERLAGSQFLITLGDNIDYLDGKAAPFGMVVEGFDTLEKINNAFTDSNGRPLKDIRIRHTIILEDPYDDPPGLVVPDSSPAPTKAQLATVMIADDEELEEEVDEAAMEKLRREREARAQALTLEMVGDLPFAEVKPPENVLFVCKLNPVTNDEDLELIFSRFGKILSCEVIRDKRTGDSLQYAFIEFENQKDCEQAYFKMQGVLIDDHRIHVDFSQSVSKLSDTWRDATNSKRARQSGGFGGIASLEKRRHYREDDGRAQNGGKYRMVFDKDDIRRKKESRREEGPRRSRSRSPRYDRKEPRRDEHRSRDQDRHGHRDRRERDQYRDRDRDRDRDGDRDRGRKGQSYRSGPWRERDR
ncbi:peptidyl-prolyl cis-trans isomerase-like 4 [Cladophialophora bantiana CBS 173.52]|uniref:Peptidyl-prolyl cis-trans isomerase n=1 Tax=Cladophialophora bantiana (strain ATCC 10958 / CBS 173.52 / CDC B-1940 / NIH 8579) TaxID=1442370 RepID=A0A0D2H4A5_CLAB1|nr:peptidyl-prolyl cis-trans isomerase-like 4 [Cladophialophora bantiana CBS 173.52]KIW88103.1 peptidyl-prolyl cis-trans isomerase-like 4 [Cladophialophora bantiana CBS 173.52]